MLISRTGFGGIDIPPNFFARKGGQSGFRTIIHGRRRTAGFSLHTGVAAKAYQRRKPERLCRYVARPAVATDRLALTPQGDVRYTLKTPYRDGTIHILLEPLDFIARLDHLEEPEPHATPTHPARAPPAAAQRDGS